jgi:vacuolar-type H+-ATPase subunit C/Vma6
MTTEMTGGPGMQTEMFSYNVDNAYPESLVRALRKGMLSQQNYESLRTVSNPAEFKLALEDTDYGNDIFTGQEAGGFET